MMHARYFTKFVKEYHQRKCMKLVLGHLGRIIPLTAGLPWLVIFWDLEVRIFIGNQQSKNSYVSPVSDNKEFYCFYP